MVAESLTLPEGESPSGRSLSLLEALSAVRDANGRLSAARAYWKLTRAMAEYRFALAEYTRLGELQPGASDRGLLQTFQAASATLLGSAELAVVEAQHELAEAAMLPAGTQLPLPADRPHVGSYDTYFEQIFAAEGEPARLRLINRLLPIERREIAACAAAVQAAGDVLDSASDAYRAGQANLPALFSSLNEWGRRRRELMDAVTRYNHDIAEYALNARPDVSAETVVSMLIGRKPNTSGTPAKTNNATTATAPFGVRPAEYTQPIPAQPPTDEPRPAASQPTVAAPPNQPTPALPQPTLAPPRDQATSARGAAPAAGATDGSGTLRDSSGGTSEPPSGRLPHPVPAEPADQSSASQQGEASGSTWAPAKESSEATVHIAQRRDTGGPGAGSASARYPALFDAQPGARAKQLTAALCGNPAALASDGETIRLADCMRGVPRTSRAALIDAYWLACRRAAEYQVSSDQTAMLQELVPVVLERRKTPGGPEQMLWLQAARSAAEVQVIIAEAELLVAEFELTRLAGRRLDSTWLIPSTSPHAGPYRLNLESLPRQLAESWPIRRLGAMIPNLANHVQDLATVVVAADMVRDQAGGEYQAGARSLQDVLAMIDEQTEETRRFLEGLCAYNQAIAHYAAAVVPPSIPENQFVGTLVLTP